jgi:hypothetical protein
MNAKSCSTHVALPRVIIALLYLSTAKHTRVYNMWKKTMRHISRESINLDLEPQACWPRVRRRWIWLTWATSLPIYRPFWHSIFPSSVVLLELQPCDHPWQHTFIVREERDDKRDIWVLEGAVVVEKASCRGSNIADAIPKWRWSCWAWQSKRLFCEHH